MKVALITGITGQDGAYLAVTFPELVAEMVNSDLEIIAKEFQHSERSYEQV
jgi:GDP-D-mannose dehydratase